MQIQVVDDWKLDLAKGFMTVLGFDARYYLGLDRKKYIGSDCVALLSFGSERICFSSAAWIIG
ncbi:MAG: hypothetical protein IPK94_05620 [Saprospiraceae bacterium]|nr:hypothetical protein [Saprospiraceae bacterium]